MSASRVGKCRYSVPEPTHEESVRLIGTAHDAGINLIDTADVYSRGESEQIAGQAIRGRRDDVVLATKFSNPMGESPHQRGGSRRWIARAVEGSLTHLAMTFVIAHPGVTAALLGPRTTGQLEDLLAGAGVTLSNDVLDQSDAIVPPGTGVGQLQMGYQPSALAEARLRRRPAGERPAA
jgi:aryl-alcohol dehydrogenase-like predicted oxidoreductase